MTVGYPVVLRNAQLDAVTTYAGNGARLRIYNGTRPATGAAITAQVLLAELVCGSPLAPAAASGLLTGNPVASDTAADNNGTATWWRLVKADGSTFVADGDAGLDLSGAELILDDVVIVAGQPVDVGLLLIARGNA